jgi:hypothetical protein
MSDSQGETLTDLRVSYHVTLQHYYEQGLHCVVVYRHYGLALTHYLFSRSRQPQCSQSVHVFDDSASPDLPYRNDASGTFSPSMNYFSRIAANKFFAVRR